MLRILLVEDSADDAELLRLALQEYPIPAELTRVDCKAALERELQKRNWDLVVCDRHLPDLDALTALEMVRAARSSAPALPVIVMSGDMGLSAAVEAMQRGARDCIGKDELPRLILVLEREIAHARADAALCQARDALQQVAEQDPVTGLPNRPHLERLLQTLLDTPATGGCGVLLIEAGHNSHAIRALGPAASRQWQLEMALRIKAIIGPDDILAHLDENSFALAIPHCEHEETLTAMAAPLLAALASPFLFGDCEIAISSRAGGCFRRNADATAEGMLLAATAALLDVNASRGGAYRLHTPEMRRAAERRLMLESALHKALLRKEFTLEYQPKIELASARSVAAEALLRWQHPVLGPISPFEFIPILEDSGLIIDVGRWVLDEACRQVCQWEKDGLPPIDIAVNLSAQQFCDQHLIDMVSGILASTGLPPSRVELEITETVAVNGEASTTAVMHALHQLGVRIALDDFGTGYSSLGYLKRFPIDTLKIDRMFITDLGDCEVDRNIVRAIMNMAHSLGLKVVAEGIETRDQLDFLATCDCDVVQGYLCSRPLTPDIFAQCLITGLNK